MPADNDRRRELRVTLPIQLSFNILESEEDYIRGHHPSLLGIESVKNTIELEGRDDLEKFLTLMDKKLDLIISLLTEKMERKEYAYSAKVLDISESGMRVMSASRLPLGAILEIGLNIPGQMYKTIDIAGRVMWELPPEEHEEGDVCIAGIKYTNIQMHDQDAIVHWIFQRQREEIRRQREEE